MKLSPKDYQTQLPLPATERWPDGVWDIEAFRNGSMSLVFFAPRQKDYQTFHDQDELYLVLKGAGVFEIAGERCPFEAGDVLFVPAGKRHRFVEFDEDIQTWAIFYGPAGGEIADGI